jgi:superfamily II DNA or RNA helicase
MYYLVTNKIYLTGWSDKLKNTIKAGLTLPNPLYWVLKRRGNMRALYAIKQEFKYYEEKAGTLIIPRGSLDTLELFIKNKGLECEVDTMLSKNKLNREFKSNDDFKYRDYQLGVIDEILEKDNGVIKLDTAFGKTIVALKLVEATQLKTLIIVPRSSILDQFIEESKKYFDYEPGVIQGKVWKIKDITIASISTLQQRDLKEIVSHFGMVIVDECQGAVTDARLKVIQSFNPSRLYGMSATPDREDGQGGAIRFVFGPIIIDRVLPQVKPSIWCLDSDVYIQVDEYTDMVSEQVKHPDRNRVIANAVHNEIAGKRKVLILTKRIEHYKLIAEMLDPKLAIHEMSSQIKESVRSELIKQLRDNTIPFDCLLGTFSLLSTGINIPALDTLIIAGDLKSKILTRQSAGRILRIFEGKQDPKIIDIVDSSNKIFHRQALGRRKFYNEQGWQIIKN